MGRRSRNTSQDCTFNGNGRLVKGKIAFLERSSSSEDDNHGHGHEEGGRAHRIRANHTQCLILGLKSNDVPRPICIHPTKLSALFPRGRTVHDLFSFFAPSPGLVVVLVPVRRKSRTPGQKEKKRSIRPHQARLLPYAYACTYRPWLALSICTYRVSVWFYRVLIPINRHPFSICFSSFCVAIRFHSHGPSGSLKPQLI